MYMYGGPRTGGAARPAERAPISPLRFIFIQVMFMFKLYSYSTFIFIQIMFIFNIHIHTNYIHIHIPR